MSLNNRLTGQMSRILLAICLLGTSTLKAQENTPRSLEVKDYAQWESLGFSRAFSDDGNWFYYQIRKNSDHNELRLHNLNASTQKVLPQAERAQFSKDSRWLAYFITPTPEKRKKSKGPLRNDFRLLNLSMTDSITVKDVSSFAFSDDSRFLAMKHYAAKGKKSKGADLLVRDLSTGMEYNFGNVTEFAWQDEGGLLALLIDADGKAGNGVQLFDSKTGTLRVLDSKKAHYSGLKWREESADLALFRSHKDKTYKDSTQHILAWKNLGAKKESAHVLAYDDADGFPAAMRIVNNRPLTWTKDGASVFTYITEWAKVPAKADSADKKDEKIQDLTDEAPALQIWHSKDVQVIPEQQQRASRRREDQFLSVWHLSANKFVQLANDLVESVNLQTDQKLLIGSDATPYEQGAMFGRGSRDSYTIDIQSGNRTKVLTKKSFVSDLGPNGRYLPYIEGNDVFVTDLNTGTTKNLTEGIDANFSNQEDDHPYPEKFPYGFVAWEKSGKSFFVNSQYDIWQLAVDGSNSRKITDGSANKTRYRFTYVDFEDYIDAREPMYIGLFGTWNKKSGYASVVPGKAVKNLVWEDVRVSRLTKAENADRFAFVSETFSDSPDFFTASEDFSDVSQLSETNPFQKDFHWGKSELIEYTNHNGKLLQGTLFYPANYDPSRKYPMITYIYERLSDGLHSYGHPSQRNYYSHSVFTHEGYFVLRPDIVFDAGDPGISSVKTLEAAVKKVVDMGLVDEKRVGLVGHSWGGYQAGYVVTQTDIFSASVAGAGLTNFSSMYGMIAWAFGGAPESAHFEVSQERMKVPPYEDIEGYIRNSSVFNVDKLNTPLLFEVGDNDKNVDWRQGIEYYNVARRAGKQFVLLVYAKEGHGLRQDKNRADYQMRILKWFGHYLKGDEAASWIEQGIPYEKQMEDLKNWKK